MNHGTRAFLRCTRVALATATWACLVPVGSAAQEPPASVAQGEPAPVEPVPLEEVFSESESLPAKLNALLPSEASRANLKQLASEVARNADEIQPRLAAIRADLPAAPNVRRLEDWEKELGGLLQRYRASEKAIDGQLQAVTQVLEKLGTLEARWQATLAEARKAGSPRTLTERIAQTQREIARQRDALETWRNEILGVRQRVSASQTSLNDTLEAVQTQLAARLEGIFSLDREPIWAAAFWNSMRDERAKSWRESLNGRIVVLGRYATRVAGVLGFQLLLFVGLAVGLHRLRARARARAEDDYNLREAQQLFEVPISLALFMALIVPLQLHSAAPPLFLSLVAVVLVVPTALIVRRLAPPAFLPLVWALIVLLLVDRATELFDFVPAIDRLIRILEFLGAFGFLLWLMRPSRLAEIPLGAPMLRLTAITIRIASVLLALAVVADCLGLGDLAEFLGGGTLRSGFRGLLLYALLKATQSLMAYALVGRPLRLLRGITRRRLFVRRQMDRALVGIALLWWVYLALDAFGLTPWVWSVSSRLMDAGVSVGALAISLGDVLVFVVTVWLSFLLARLVNYVLREDVFSRLRVGRGIPYAVSSLTRYTLIFLGLLVGLAAAGIELSKLTIIAGGLGVGIGFGLQNIVNNFVSGLILLFERPFQVGDAVQLPEVWGEIKRIGIRASVIRSWQGAEVIVPNGKLLADSVTNWTLSDRRRRLEMNVGVEYGTPAQRVIDLLVGVAQAHEEVLSDPPPQAFFMEFGDSSLNFLLRAWIADFDRGYIVRSELGVAIQEALRQADIGVPFPQRDLHLRSVSGQAAVGLGMVEPQATRGIPPASSGGG